MVRAFAHSARRLIGKCCCSVAITARNSNHAWKRCVHLSFLFEISSLPPGVERCHLRGVRAQYLKANGVQLRHGAPYSPNVQGQVGWPLTSLHLFRKRWMRLRVPL
jgi:hypothetical protein